MQISQVVIPAAGFGTRFLPITKTVPKGMLPVLNKPALQYIVEEAAASGVHNICTIVGDEHSAIEKYFSHNKKLEAVLEKRNKFSLIEDIHTLIDQCQFTYIIQEEMLGLGHAILLAKEMVHEDYFGVILPDDIIFGPQPCLQQLIAVAQKEHAAVIAVMEVSPEEISAYGCIKIGTQLQEDLVEVVDIIEKPQPHEAFSNRAIIGRYVLPTAIFQAIEAITPHATGEIQLTDALTHLINNGHKVLAYTIKGTRFDIGRPPGWFAANMYAGMQSPSYGTQIREIIDQLRHTS